MLPSILFISLLFAFDAVYGARTTKCKVKRKQGVLQLPSTPTSTSPATNLPTTGSSSSSEVNPTSTPVLEQLPPFDYSTRKMRGVNLGGWFLMEPWITPSMFDNTGNDDIVDEYTFGLLQDRSVALEKLEEHWSTFYTEQDFIEMKEYGLNHIRLPISYWAVPIEQDVGPYIPGAWPHILRALDWARKHELHVIMDLHGAPGSQNGFDNSGQRTGDPRWAYEESYFQQTIQVIEFLAREIADKVEVIQLLNEIAGFREGFAEPSRRYWQEGYETIRRVAGDRVRVMIGDAFLTVGNWEGFLTLPEATGVIMDLHVYQIFSVGELLRSDDEHIQFMCNRIPEFTNYARNNNWLIMGEWSLAKTDCTNYLNGRGIGARWDGTHPSNMGEAIGSCEGLTGKHETFSDEYKTFLRRYWEAQVTVAEMAQGWVYWTWKAENSDDWSYKTGVEQGYIPRDPDDRLYPNICD